MKTLDQLFENASLCSEYSQSYVRYLTELLASIDYQTVQKISDILGEAREKGKTAFCIGNGGSAATASHFVTDLAWGARVEGVNRSRAVSLSANVPYLTAIANDSGYENAFVEQMRGLFQQGDILVAISASGNSENVLRAIRYANDLGGITIGLVGFDGGKMKAECRICLHVETKPGEYAPVEDVHHSICHIVATYLKRKIARF
jgi:D-sedoheptulose 7-phosphate isomerase